MGQIKQNTQHGTRWLLLVLVIFSLLTLYNSSLLPLGEAADETDHYQYLRFVARTGHPPLTEAGRNEAGFKGGLAPLYYWLTAWPIALVGEETPPDIRRVDSRPERHIPTDGLGINHVLHTLDEQLPWRGQTLAWHLVRFLSLPLGWLTIIATYALVRRLMPEQKFVAIGATAFVALLPRFVISSAVINDDNLVFALTTLLLLVQVAILQGNHRPLTMAAFGALFGLSLVTKYFSLILVPEILLTLIMFYRATKANPADLSTPAASRSALYLPLFAFLMALLITAGLWFSFIVIRFNRIDELGLIPGLAASLGEPQITEGLVGLISGQPVRPPAATYSLGPWFSLLYRSFWFEYGWMQIFAPAWVYGLFTMFLLAATGGLAAYFLGRGPRPTPCLTLPISQDNLAARAIPWLLGLHLTLFVVVVLARYMLSATIDTGQGRHLYPALPVIAWLVALGLQNFSLKIHNMALLRLPTRSLPLPVTGYVLILGCLFLIPALVSLQPAAYVLPRYHTLPVTMMPPNDRPVTHGRPLPLADGLSLAGFEAADTVSAGDALPVTLVWQAEQEADRDFLVSVCLQDRQDRAVACWRGHFDDGHYPARAWEAGDRLIDTIYVPVPTCYRLAAQPYHLRLEVWPLAMDSPAAVTEGPPLLATTLAEPEITIRPSDPTMNRPQAIDWWRAGQRLAGPVQIELRESIAQITYSGQTNPAPPFENRAQTMTWLPLPDFETALFLPCGDGPSPFATLTHFITDPTLPTGSYEPAMIQTDLTLMYAPRTRTLSPLQSTLTFAEALAPLTLQLPDLSAIDLGQTGQADPLLPVSLPSTTRTLPITLRWQARRWLADPLIVSLKLLDKDFMVGGERIATLGDRYPNVLWAPTEIVEETYPVRIQPDAPPGLYRLELSLIRQGERLPDGFAYLPLTDGQTTLGNNLYPVTVRLLDPAHDTPPPQPFSAQLGDALELIGYDVNSQSKAQNLKSKINLVLYWQSTAKIPLDYTVFTQLIGPDGQVWAQWDNPPQAGRYPTSAWTGHDQVVDRYSLTLRAGAPPGEYRLLVGMYEPATGQRLPAAIDGQPQPDNAIELTRLTLNP